MSFFFFSSRRRHTRWPRDWSSDVCSSDLEMLWQYELSARPIDTPERRADLEHRLMAQAGLIADRTVQTEYRRFLRERLFQLGRGARPSQIGRASCRERGGLTVGGGAQEEK